MMIDTYHGEPIDAFDQSKVEACAMEVAAEMAVRRSDPRPVVIDFQPGNGSRYVVVLTPMTTPASRDAIGNDWLISMPLKGTCYPIAIPSYFTAEYLIERGLARNISDALPLSMLLNHTSVTFIFAPRVPPEGLVSPAETPEEAAEDWTGVPQQ